MVKNQGSPQGYSTDRQHVIVEGRKGDVSRGLSRVVQEFFQDGDPERGRCQGWETSAGKGAGRMGVAVRAVPSQE